ncbi:hypothetical protein COK36_17915 [Bacillus cereus]|nr:hypothetical protein CN462_22800 [Bacillus cereus]PFL22840.1 hypothetical protein COJ22_16250 [Bacillus cereus]PFR59944.1 hypothetical protein COK36_17915 [Bacillus cereus]PGW95255.1 hypothetical protein COE19_11185 [Bacillus cereus]PGY92306.1 hypothetical protein COE38_15595 [Bacillus cereus]
MILLLFLAFLLNYIVKTDDLYLVLIKKDPVMYSGLRNINSYGLRLLSETKFLIIHGFSYKIKSYIRVLKEIWILKSVDEGMRDTDTNFKESYSKYVFYSIKASLCIMLTVVLI